MPLFHSVHGKTGSFDNATQLVGRIAASHVARMGQIRLTVGTSACPPIQTHVFAVRHMDDETTRRLHQRSNRLKRCPVIVDMLENIEAAHDVLWRYAWRIINIRRDEP
jgi:hypothetical protein